MGSYLNPGGGLFRACRRSKIYVDKSNLITKTNEVLGTEQRFVCVSRPQRFGKSMAANMLAAIMVGMNLNFDGLKDAVIRMLAGDKVQINTGTFSNDMTTFQGMDDVLTLLVHLGYLSYHWPDRTVTIPNKEMYKCFNKTAHLYH